LYQFRQIIDFCSYNDQYKLPIINPFRGIKVKTTTENQTTIEPLTIDK